MRNAKASLPFRYCRSSWGSANLGGPILARPDETTVASGPLATAAVASSADGAMVSVVINEYSNRNREMGEIKRTLGTAGAREG